MSVRPQVRHRMAAIAVATALSTQAWTAVAATKTVEKGLFIAGLLALGGVVRSLDSIDRDRSAYVAEALRLELGPPTSADERLKGFDRLRAESYGNPAESLVATYRNGLVSDVRSLNDAPTPVLTAPLLSAGSSAEDLDRRLFRRIHDDLQFEPLSTSMSALNRLGSSTLILAASAGAVALGSPGVRDTGKLVGAGFVASAATTWVLKRAVGRPRPLNPDDHHSMPSGHATNAFAVATALGHRYPSYRLPLYALAASVAFARVHLGRHFPSDVLAGAAIGVVVSTVVLRAEDKILSLGW